MKKLILIQFSVLFSIWSNAQIISETVSFDNYTSASYNDLSTFFKFGTFATNGFIRQITTNGITGGALEPPSNVNGGNDVIQYCSIYKNSKDSLIETSLAFFYNSSLINPNANADGIVILLEGNTNNHNVGFVLTEDQELAIAASNYNQRIQVNLTSGHWYNFVGQYKTIGGAFNDQVFTKVEIFDLGITGNSLPISVGSHTATLYDSYLVSSNDFIVELSAAKWGGSEYLDNFVFKGEKNGSICSISNIYDLQENDLIVYPNPTYGEINVILPSNIKYNQYTISFYDLIGKKIKSQIYSENSSSSLSLSEFQPGIYFMTLEFEDKISKPHKIVLIK
jgi:hypothetical protein